MEILQQKQALSKGLIKILVVLLAAVLLFRLWPLAPVLLLLILGQGIRLARLEYQKTHCRVVLPLPEGFRIPAHQPKQELCVQITDRIRRMYPEASWVWETPEGERELLERRETALLLNRAGGYRRAKIMLDDQNAVTLEFSHAPQPTASAASAPEPEQDGDLSDEEDPSLPENYGLIAFEWVDAHLMELDHLCNEAIGRGEDSVLIPGEDLPSRESWEEVCRELARNALENTRITPEGVRIILTR